MIKKPTCPVFAELNQIQAIIAKYQLNFSTQNPNVIKFFETELLKYHNELLGGYWEFNAYFNPDLLTESQKVQFLWCGTNRYYHQLRKHQTPPKSFVAPHSAFYGELIFNNPFNNFFNHAVLTGIYRFLRQNGALLWNYFGGRSAIGVIAYLTNESYNMVHRRLKKAKNRVKQFSLSELFCLFGYLSALAWHDYAINNLINAILKACNFDYFMAIKGRDVNNFYLVKAVVQHLYAVLQDIKSIILAIHP